MWEELINMREFMHLLQCLAANGDVFHPVRRLNRERYVGTNEGRDCEGALRTRDDVKRADEAVASVRGV